MASSSVQRSNAAGLHALPSAIAASRTLLRTSPLRSPGNQIAAVGPQRVARWNYHQGDGFYDKTRLIRESPYDQTIFVDADIYVAEPFPELFSLLDRFDCAATHEEYLDTDWFHRYPRPDIPTSFPEFNTGILLLKRSALMDRVLVTWADLYKRFLEENTKSCDQRPAFFSRSPI